MVRANPGCPWSDSTGAMAAVFQFVYGFGTTEGHFVQRTVEAGLNSGRVLRAVAMSTAQGGAPERRRTCSRSPRRSWRARGGGTVEEMRERDFHFALDLVVTGIEAMVDRP